jgi:hypothetical protein
MLIDVYEQNLAPSSSIIDVQNIDDLARLAERHSTMILHMKRNFLHYYFVQNNSTTYRYVVSAGKHGIADETYQPANEITQQVESIQMDTPASAPAKLPQKPSEQKPRIVYVYQPQPEMTQPTIARPKVVNAQQPAKETVHEYEYMINTGKINFDFTDQETLLPKIKL